MTITGVDDNVADVTFAYAFVVNAAVSSDPVYNGMKPADIAVANTDNCVIGYAVIFSLATSTDPKCQGNVAPSVSLANLDIPTVTSLQQI